MSIRVSGGSGTKYAYPFRDLPDSFQVDPDNDGRYLFTYSGSDKLVQVQLNQNKTLEIMFAFSESVDIAFDGGQCFIFYNNGSNSDPTLGTPIYWTGTTDLIVNGDVVSSVASDQVMPYGDYKDVRYISIVLNNPSYYFGPSVSYQGFTIGLEVQMDARIVTNSGGTGGTGGEGGEGGTGGEDGGNSSADFSEVLDEIRIIQSSLDEISGKVSVISETVVDMKEQLEDPTSNIWQAAGQAIKDAVTSLFVPSQAEIEEVKQGFDQLAKDKLGGAYQAMETVENTITEVNDKLNNPSATEGIEFPGISVPLGGEVGTVTIAEPQLVTLPTNLTAILHPVAGTIISIVVGLGTFNSLKDMVECFLSGFSFSEYLHRSKGSDDS